MLPQSHIPCIIRKGNGFCSIIHNSCYRKCWTGVAWVMMHTQECTSHPIWNITESVLFWILVRRLPHARPGWPKWRESGLAVLPSSVELADWPVDALGLIGGWLNLNTEQMEMSGTSGTLQFWFNPLSSKHSNIQNSTIEHVLTVRYKKTTSNVIFIRLYNWKCSTEVDFKVVNTS